MPAMDELVPVSEVGSEVTDTDKRSHKGGLRGTDEASKVEKLRDPHGDFPLAGETLSRMIVKVPSLYTAVGIEPAHNDIDIGQDVPGGAAAGK